MDCMDLMIGDWVKVEQTTETVTARVLGVHKDGVINYEVDYSGVRATDITHADYVSPIGLTEDILLKNGFEKNHNDEAPAEECYFYRLFAKPCGWFDIDAFGLEEELGAEFTYHDININYVHQLQHLLRLAGVQKEIEL